MYIDETKARNYLMVAAAVVPEDDREVRGAVRSLILPGQRRLHMHDERDSRRRQILSTLTSVGVTATIYDAGGAERPQLTRRAACLAAIATDAHLAGHYHLVLEQDETLLRFDREQLIECLRAIGNATLTYEHRPSGQEILLGIPDAIAWAWARGGDWRRRARPLVTDVRHV